MSVTETYVWSNGALEPLEEDGAAPDDIAAADSWFVTDGAVLALDLHRERFLGAVEALGLDASADDLDARAFWDGVIEAIPRGGDWFPRVELRLREAGPLFVFRLRGAPERSRSARLMSLRGDDPRSAPGTKGPGTAALLRARSAAQSRGADEAVILSPDGYVVEGTSSALLWWRGEILCGPALHLERVDSVTARSVVALATALGLDVYYEAVRPSELEGVELWALNALHGIRIVTTWLDGPAMAEKPGRLGIWRARLDRLRRPLP
ncbi:MAG TPA: aminotransferase class IV [Lacisediminihabitans sp.]|uniref:aminotransferase class IV n=1 Tax=Lacisediminihabitans sp. TaxID=2787631 RepID=UPI002ED8366B